MPPKVAVRYPLGPLAKFVAGGEQLSQLELAVRLNLHPRQLVRYVQGGIPEPAADRLACRAGVTPELIWPEQWNDGALEQDDPREAVPAPRAAGRQAAEYELVFEEPPAPKRVAGGAAATRPSSAPRPRSRWADYIAPDTHRAHGTYVKYVIEHCHCEPCRKANREYERERQRRMRRPDEVWCPYVPAGRARAHLQELAAQGVGPKTVAKLSGVPHGSISRIMYGGYGDRGKRRPPSKRIRPETERKILAVEVRDAAGGQKIPGGPTWKLLDDLIARGFSKSWIARELGSKGPGLQIRRDVVRASTAKKVRELHAQLEGAEPPPRLTRWGPRPR